MKPIKTTPEQFELFKAEVRRLIDIFHIDGWKVFYEFKLLKNANAQLWTDVTERSAKFILSTTNTLSDSDYDVKDAALHEVCHLIMADVVDLGDSRFVSHLEYTSACERVTRKIQALLSTLVN